MAERPGEQLVRPATLDERRAVERTGQTGETIDRLERTLSNDGMTRRSFLAIALAGISTVTGFSREAYADEEVLPDQKRMLVTIFMRGGRAKNSGPLLHRGATDASHTHGPFKAPPLNMPGTPAGLYYVDDPKNPGNPIHWLQVHGKNTISAIIDMETNSHTTGQERRRGSDDMSIPALPDLYAYSKSPGNSMAHLTNTNMSYAGQLTPATPVDRLRELLEMTEPNKTQTGRHLPEQIESMLNERLVAELADSVKGDDMPRLKKQAADRMAAQSAADKLRNQFAIIDSANGEQDQLFRAYLMAKGMHKMGDLAALSLEADDFDTHNRPNDQFPRQNTVWQAIHRMRVDAAADGVNLDIIVQSDFSREPIGGDTSNHHPTNSIDYISDRITEGMLAGQEDQYGNITGTRFNFADGIDFGRDFLKLNGTNFGTNTQLTEVTATDAIKNELGL